MARKKGSFSHNTGPQIRAAALRLIARDGFAAVSMRQIAAEVGLQAGALYNYTPDKDALLFDFMTGHWAELTEGWQQAPKGRDPLDQLQAFVGYHLGWCLERPEAMIVAEMERRNLSAANLPKVLALRDAYGDLLVTILEKGEAVGAFKPIDAGVSAAAILAMLNDLARRAGDGNLPRRQRVERQYWRLIQRLVRAKPPDRR